MNPKKWRGWCANACGKPVSKGAEKYCSIRCEHDMLFKKRVAQLEAGQYPPRPFSSSFIKKYLAVKLGERCSRCGWAEVHPQTGRVPVEVEHIDGNWQNNHPSNLTLLCPNCHSLTATYRGLNKGKGRALRRGGRHNPICEG